MAQQNKLTSEYDLLFAKCGDFDKNSEQYTKEMETRGAKVLTRFESNWVILIAITMTIKIIIMMTKKAMIMIRKISNTTGAGTIAD